MGRHVLLALSALLLFVLDGGVYGGGLWDLFIFVLFSIGCMIRCVLALVIVMIESIGVHKLGKK